MSAYKFDYSVICFIGEEPRQYPREGYFSSYEVFLAFLNHWNKTYYYKYFESDDNYIVNLGRTRVDFEYTNETSESLLFYGLKGGEQATHIKVKEG